MSVVDDTKNSEMASSPSPVKSSKSSPTKKDIDVATQALNHFAQGKRHLLVNDINSAVNSLQDASRLLAQHYGETAPECADVYYYYGRSLLELARIENGVLGNALDGVPEGDDAENSQIEDPEKMTEEDGSTESEGDKDQQDEEDEEQQEGDEDEAEKQEGNEEENHEDDEGENTEDEDASNLQIAWEMFELSKMIYEKQEPVNEKKLAQVYLKLGEVGLESENYNQSIEDFTSCLELQKKALPSDDRCLAETYYQLGVANSFIDDFDKAIDNFGAAAKVIETRISNLKDKIKLNETWSEEQKRKAVVELEDPFYTEQGEIDELDKLLPEIKEKLVDMEEMKKDTKDKLEKVKEATFASILGGSRVTESSSSEATTSEGFSGVKVEGQKIEARPTSNISHLIRKKRKPEEEVEKVDLKKAKGEDGEAKQAPAVNGTSEKGSEEPDKMETDTVSDTTEESKTKAVPDVAEKPEESAFKV